MTFILLIIPKASVDCKYIYFNTIKLLCFLQHLSSFFLVFLLRFLFVVLWTAVIAPPGKFWEQIPAICLRGHGLRGDRFLGFLRSAGPRSGCSVMEGGP